MLVLELILRLMLVLRDERGKSGKAQGKAFSHGSF
jgi:hypothetical protein